MMQAVKKLLFAISISSALALTGVANTQGFGQDRKPPERPKEKEKQDKDENKDRRNDEKKGDDKKGGDRKKP